MEIEKRFCVSCGQQLREGTAFCEKCGAAVPTGAAASVARPTPVTDAASGPAKPPVLPPHSGGDRKPSPAVHQDQLGTPSGSTTAPSWMLPLVGLALVVVLMGVGVKLLKSPKTTQNPLGSSGGVTSASSQDASPSPPVESATASTQQASTDTPEPVAAEPAVVQQPEPPPAVNADPLETDIPGIERIPLDRAESYLPLPRSRYRHYMSYPDGDDGHRDMVVAASDDGRVTTILEFTHSRLYPDDPPGLWVNHYVSRPDGVYRYSDDDPYRAELWLPNDLALGKTWSNVLGDFEVVGFDQTLTVNGVPFQGVLSYRHRSSVTDIDQTIWLGLGHGEIQGRYGQNGAEFCRLLKAESEPESRIDELVKRHVVNLDKVR